MATQGCCASTWRLPFHPSSSVTHTFLYTHAYWLINLRLYSFLNLILSCLPSTYWFCLTYTQKSPSSLPRMFFFTPFLYSYPQNITVSHGIFKFYNHFYYIFSNMWWISLERVSWNFTFLYWTSITSLIRINKQTLPKRYQEVSEEAGLHWKYLHTSFYRTLATRCVVSRISSESSPFLFKGTLITTSQSAKNEKENNTRFFFKSQQRQCHAKTHRLPWFLTN